MTWSPSSPVTGSAQTGLTSPTYTLSADSTPTPNGKQWAVTAIGGTQPSVNVTGAGTPFTISFFKPLVNKIRSFFTDGRANSVPTNVYKQITRKSLAVDAFGTTRLGMVTTIFEVPAGAEAQVPGEVRAMISLHIGTLNQCSAGIGDTVVQGVL